MIVATTSLALLIPLGAFLIAADGDTPQNIGVTITQYSALIVALIALIGTFVSRKVKSPADELARADFAYKKITDRLEEVNKDRAYLQSVVDTLREQLKKFDSDAMSTLEDKRKLRELVSQGDDRIEQLLKENEVLEARLKNIADKVRENLPITLADVYGVDADVHTPTIEEIELTVPATRDIPRIEDPRRKVGDKE